MQTYRAPAAAFLAALLLPLTAFSSTQAASSRPRQVLATTPMIAVQATVFGEYRPNYSEYTCSTQLPAHRIAAWSTCPFTLRFRQRLTQPGHANRGVELCGNQYPPRVVRLHHLSRTATTARINAYWDLGAHNAYTSTFVVIRHNGWWLVDDEYLAGKPSYDIYREGVRSFCG